MATDSRPWGVTLLSVLSFISVSTYLVLGVLALASPENLAGLLEGLSPQGSGPAMLLEMGRGLVVYFAVMSVLGGLFGYGLWTLRNWARWVTIVLAGVSLIATLAGLMGLGRDIDLSAVLLVLFRAGLCVIVLWYLWRPSVRTAFRRHDIHEPE